MLTDTDFTTIVEHIKKRYGIELIQKRLLIEGRLSYTFKKHGFDDFHDYIMYVLNNTNTQRYIEFVDKLTTNHTYFMREKDHFDMITKEILPHIENSVKDRDVRIWSAGCSFGNEPYNLAMVIDDYFGESAKNWDLKILATDISSNALNHAKAGIYKPSDIEDLPEKWQNKYFNKTSDGNFQVSKQLRSQVVFKYFNLMDEFKHKKPFDLILCRNVMIYFNSETRDNLVEKFYQNTKQGGYLLIGHAENVSVKSRFKMIKPSVLRHI